MIGAMIDFSKAFDSVMHPIIFHTLISAGLPSYFALGLNLFFDRCGCIVFQNH